MDRTQATPEAKRAVWIADDGELRELRQLLRELHVPIRELEAGQKPTGALLLSGPRQALALEASGLATHSDVHIVVITDSSRSARTRLERSKCDFVVDANAHPAVLRLLVEYALYAGPERRRHPRAAMNTGVRIRVGRRSRAAHLMQLSERGCGLLCEGVEAQAEVLVTLPSALTGAKPMEVKGRAISAIREADGGMLVSVVFAPLTARAALALRTIMSKRRLGRPLLSEGGSAREKPASASPPRAERAGTSASGDARRASSSASRGSRSASDASSSHTGSPAAKAAGAPSDRRRAPRARYGKPILATHSRGALPLLGQDLSAGGMRIASNSELGVGDQLKLALYGRRGEKPVVVRARVVRDGGRAGFGLAFAPLADPTAERLEKLIASLPVLGAKRSDRAGGSKRAQLIVTEILERDAAEPE